MSTSKPHLFIGSSREAIFYARAIHAQLRRNVQVTPWYAGTFEANLYTMEALERKLDESDFGIFVFAPDDVASIRGKHVFVTRDNTLFEMGLFWGKLRRQRVFCIVPNEVKMRDDLIDGVKVQEYHVLSDLQGMTLLEYEWREDENYPAAVDVACGEILQRIEKEGLYTDPHELLRNTQVELMRKQSVLHFFWEYTRNVTVADSQEKYHALSEAVRNSLLPPDGFRATGAVFWKKIGNDGIAQVGGNVGKGRFFFFAENQDKPEEQKTNVLEAYFSGKLVYYKKKTIAEVYVLCYPLGTDHVLSAHITGPKELTNQELNKNVLENNDLLVAISYLLGGDS